MPPVQTPPPPSRRALREAAVLGGVAGLRSLTPLAALAARGELGGPPAGRGALLAGAAGELVGDKLPGVPSRTRAPVLGGRIAAGALVGARVAGPLGAAAAAATAAASTVAATKGRAALGRRTGLPDPVLGAVEDVLAAGAAFAATRPRSSPPPPRPSPLAAVARGVAAGVAGTAAMSAAQAAYYRLTDAQPSRTPAEVGRRIARGLLRREVPAEREGPLNTAMHWAYGTSWGIPLGLVAGSLRSRPPAPALGAAFGLAVWGASLLELPAMGLAPPVWEYGARTLATDVGFHLVYGLAAAAALRALP